MFGVGTGEILLILVIAMLVVGPERMVSFARQLGEWIARFRRETDSVTAEFREALSLDPEESASDASPEAQAGSAQQEAESGSVAAQPTPTPVQTTAPALAAQGPNPAADRRREAGSPFADSEWGETPWPVEASASAPSASSDPDGEMIALDVAQVGSNGDELEPTLIQEPQVIVDESEPDQVGGDGEEKG